MPTLEIQVSVRLDGQNMPWSPLTHVAQVDEYQPFDYQEAGDNNDTTFSALPVGEVDTVQDFIIEAINAAGVRLEGGEATNVAVRLSDGGFIVIANATLTDTNLTVNVNSASAARLRGVAAGT